MPGQDGVGPEAGRSRRGVDVLGEALAAAVVRVDRGGRVVAGDEHGTFARLAGRGEPRELGAEEVELLVAGERRVGAVLARDDAGALQDVGVEADDRDEGRVEGEVDARLVHGGADDRACVGGRARLLGAEVAQERGQGRDAGQVGLVAEDHAVVVAGDREDRPVVGVEGLVELVVVVLALAEVVDDVAQVEEERGSGRAALLHVPRHRVGHVRLVLQRLPRGLEAVHLGRPGVADRVKADLLGRCDRVEELRAEDVRQIDSGLRRSAARGPVAGLACAACSRRSRSRRRSCCPPGTRSRPVRAAGRRTACRATPDSFR